eukprot:Transcript_9168.p1 GENE.Transcript_9168~~Transcript_9168.p1  ORF type:complete len:468 (+),score=65.48 Transcript_9168:42-1406(+)
MLLASTFTPFRIAARHKRTKTSHGTFNAVAHDTETADTETDDTMAAAAEHAVRAAPPPFTHWLTLPDALLCIVAAHLPIHDNGSRSLASCCRQLRSLRGLRELNACFRKAGCYANQEGTRNFAWSNRALNDSDMRVLADCAAAGSLSSVVLLNLRENAIGSQGVAALASALLSSKALAKLRSLNLGSNLIGDQGVAALASAMARGAMPSLTQLFLCEVGMGDAGVCALASAVSSRALVGLQDLSLAENHFGDLGALELMHAISGALTSGDAAGCQRGPVPVLRELDVSGMRVGPAGTAAVAHTLSAGAVPALKRLVMLCVRQSPEETFTWWRPLPGRPSPLAASRKPKWPRVELARKGGGALQLTQRCAECCCPDELDGWVDSDNTTGINCGACGHKYTRLWDDALHTVCAERRIKLDVAEALRLGCTPEDEPFGCECRYCGGSGVYGPRLSMR